MESDFSLQQFCILNVDSYLSPEFTPMCIHSIIHSFSRHLFDETLQKKKSKQKFLTSKNNASIMEATYTPEMGTL